MLMMFMEVLRMKLHKRNKKNLFVNLYEVEIVKVNTMKFC